MKHFIGWSLVVSMVIFVVAMSFAYNPQLQNSLYTLSGSGWVVFGTWAAIILLKEKK